jgi:DNA sulfur modification protein DndD
MKQKHIEKISLQDMASSKILKNVLWTSTRESIVKLTSVTIDNLFSYNGKQEVPFSPITCIIGSNGFGKTSILNAIKLGLGHYEVALESILNNKAETPHCGVVLTFDIFTLRRSWDFSNSIEESLVITFPNEEDKDLEGAEAEHFIENKIPKFLIDFLFYDGEVGSNLFLLSRTKLKSLFDYVFDLDLLDHVHKDSLQVAKKLLEQNSDDETNELVKLEKQRFTLIDKIESEEEAVKTQKKQLKVQQLNIQKLDTQIRNRNKKIKELHKQQDEKQAELSELSKEFKELIMCELPLLLNPTLLKELKKRSHSPLSLNDEQLFSSHFKRFLEQIGSSADTEEALSTFKGLMLTESSTVEPSLTKKAFNYLLEQMKNLQYEIKQLNTQIQDTETNAMEQEITRSLIESRDAQTIELATMGGVLEDLENSIVNDKELLKEINRTLTKLFKENQDKYAFIKGYEELQEVAKVAETIYQEELTEKLETFNKTLAKNTASFLKQYKHINEIYIDEKHRIIITDGEKKLDTELLSAGQKQVLNFLIVKSILEYKAFASFVMVDTPFGRLSNANKKLLLDECYLQFDNLILLLTDSEFEFIQAQKLKYTIYHISRNRLGSQIEVAS